MDSLRFIEKIEAAGFTLAVAGENLTITPASKLTDPQRQFIRQHKPELLRALTQTQSGPEIHPHSPAPEPPPTVDVDAELPPNFWNRARAIGEELDNIEADVRADDAPEPVHLREYLGRAADAINRRYEMTDVDALAASIAMEFNVSTAAVLGLLDDDDKREIEGGDAGMIEAWRTAVRLRDVVRYRLIGRDGKPMLAQSSVMPRPGQNKEELIEQLKREFGARLILCSTYEIRPEHGFIGDTK